MPLTLLVDRDSVFEIDGDNVHAPERYKLSGAKDAFMSAISSLPGVLRPRGQIGNGKARQRRAFQDGAL